MDLRTLREELTKRLPSEKYRPFICEGSPLDCQVFIVGINPATEIGDFWAYWDDATGFAYQTWFEDYKRARQQKGKQAVSPTRRNLAIISEELAHAGIKALETNLYTKSTARANEIRQIDKLTNAFDFLLAEIKPKLLILHGQETVREIAIKIKVPIPITGETKISLNGVEMTFISMRHLSYQFSKEQARTVGKQIIKKIKPASNIK